MLETIRVTNRDCRGLSDADLQNLSRMAPNVTKLDIGCNSELTTFSNCKFTRLRHVIAFETGLTPAGLQALCAMSATTLQKIGLSLLDPNFMVGCYFPKLTDVALTRAIHGAKPPYFSLEALSQAAPNLESLSISDVTIRCENAPFKHLRKFKVLSCYRPVEWLQAISTAYGHTLQELEISNEGRPEAFIPCRFPNVTVVKLRPNIPHALIRACFHPEVVIEEIK
jgi:hypothetical protein